MQTEHAPQNLKVLRNKVASYFNVLDSTLTNSSIYVRMITFKPFFNNIVRVNGKSHCCKNIGNYLYPSFLPFLYIILKYCDLSGMYINVNDTKFYPLGVKEMNLNWLI